MMNVALLYFVADLEPPARNDAGTEAFSLRRRFPYRKFHSLMPMALGDRERYAGDTVVLRNRAISMAMGIGFDIPNAFAAGERRSMRGPL